MCRSYEWSSYIEVTLFLIQLVVAGESDLSFRRAKSSGGIEFASVPVESHSNQKHSLSPPDPDAEVCLHALRLVQSLVLEPEVLSKSASEFRSSLPLQRILAMAKSRNHHLQTVAQELLDDLRALERDV